MRTITSEYGWQNLDGMPSTWRGDCYLGPIRQFLYKECLGYNDNTPHFSDLIREGQLTRDRALERLKSEENIDESVVRICCRKVGVDFESLMRACARIQRAGM